MSLTSYPIITYGSNNDVLRQGHNLLTTNVGDMDGLQTAANETLVDALNYLNSAFSALTVSAYPPLNNEQWLTATIVSGFGTINLFKLSDTNEFVIGQHMIPLSTLTDLGKSGTAWRAGYITTVHTTKIQAITNLEISTAATLTLSFTAGALILSEVGPALLQLESTGEGLDIKSLRTRLYSGAFLWDNTTAGHLEPGVTQTQNIGSAAKEINRVYTKNITASGDVTFNADVIAPNAGLAVPLGGGCLWFTPVAPTNYLIANGQEISRATYPALFTLYQSTGMLTVYGIGNGTTTFNLPDMRDRIPFGVNTSRTLSAPDATAPGKVFGTLNHTHNSTMPKHYHTSTGLAVADHINQSTGNPSQNPTASFAGSALAAHGHSISQTPHGHSISDGGHGHGITDPGHIHGAGLTQHRHFLDTGGRSSGNTSTDPARWFNGSNGPAQIPLMLDLGIDFNVQTELNPSGVGVGIDSHTADISINNNTSNVSVVPQVANVAVQDNSAGTPAGTVTLSNTTHSHAIPTLQHSISGTVGIVAGGSNGDVDNTLVSTTNNPPSFAVHFIIRVK